MYASNENHVCTRYPQIIRSNFNVNLGTFDKRKLKFEFIVFLSDS